MRLFFLLIFILSTLISNGQVNDSGSYCASNFKSNYNTIKSLNIETAQLDFGPIADNTYLYYENFVFPDLEQGKEIDITVDFHMLPVPLFHFHLPRYFGIWIDYNQNNTFETSELIVQNANTIQRDLNIREAVLITKKVIVPNDAKLGTTRGRIIRMNNHRINLVAPGATIVYDPNFAAQPCNSPEGIGIPEDNIVASSNIGSTYDFNITIIGNTLNTNDVNTFSKKIAIEPNPVSDFLKIKNNDPNIEVSKIEVFSLTGERVLAKKIENKTSSISLSELSPGVYLTKIYDINEVSVNFKIIKK